MSKPAYNVVPAAGEQPAMVVHGEVPVKAPKDAPLTAKFETEENIIKIAEEAFAKAEEKYAAVKAARRSAAREHAKAVYDKVKKEGEAKAESEKAKGNAKDAAEKAKAAREKNEEDAKTVSEKAKAAHEKNDEKHINAALDDLLKELQKTYHDFNVSFPIPLRYIVQLRKYDKTAFANFLRYYKSVTTGAAVKPGGGVFDNRQRFLEVQAEYPVAFYKEDVRKKGRRLDNAKVAAFRRDVVRTLEEDDKRLTEVQKDYADALSKDKQEREKQLREELYLLVVKQRAALGITTPPK